MILLWCSGLKDFILCPMFCEVRLADINILEDHFFLKWANYTDLCWGMMKWHVPENISPTSATFLVGDGRKMLMSCTMLMFFVPKHPYHLFIINGCEINRNQNLIPKKKIGMFGPIGEKWGKEMHLRLSIIINS